MSERECTEELDFRNAKSNPFGWSHAEIYHNDERIGSQHCGEFKIDHSAYRLTLTPEGKNTRVRVFCTIGEDVIA